MVFKMENHKIYYSSSLPGAPAASSLAAAAAKALSVAASASPSSTRAVVGRRTRFGTVDLTRTGPISRMRDINSFIDLTPPASIKH